MYSHKSLFKVVFLLMLSCLLVPALAACGGAATTGPVTLTLKARVTAESGNSWVITDPERGVYLVELKDGPRRLVVSSATLHLIYSDLTAIITGPNAGRFSVQRRSSSRRPKTCTCVDMG